MFIITAFNLKTRHVSVNTRNIYGHIMKLFYYERNVLVALCSISRFSKEKGMLNERIIRIIIGRTKTFGDNN